MTLSRLSSLSSEVFKQEGLSSLSRNLGGEIPFCHCLAFRTKTCSIKHLHLPTPTHTPPLSLSFLSLFKSLFLFRLYTCMCVRTFHICIIYVWMMMLVSSRVEWRLIFHISMGPTFNFVFFSPFSPPPTAYIFIYMYVHRDQTVSDYISLKLRAVQLPQPDKNGRE